MMRCLLTLALCVAPLAGATAQYTTPVPARTAELGIEHRMLLRCSAAFALVSHGQENGDAAALQWPDMSERGKEFFVRATSRVMEEAGLSRDEASAALTVEAGDLLANGTLEQVMPACLSVLTTQ